MTKTTKPAAKKTAAPKPVTPIKATIASADLATGALPEAASTTPPATTPPADDAHLATADATHLDGIRTLEQAHELPEVEADVIGTESPLVPFESDDPTYITAFKSVDRRTMRIVHVAGGLAACPIAD